MSQRRRAAAFALLAALFLGPAWAASPTVVVDDLGSQVALPAAAQRIVALAPGATALLFAAGAGDRIVATIRFADDPPAAKLIPRIGDQQSVDLERLVALRPDVVVYTEGVTSPLIVDRIRALGMPLYATYYTTLDGIAPSIRRLGALAGTQAAAQAEAARLEAQLTALRERYRGASPRSVFYQVWDRPLYTVGGRQLISDAMKACGASNIFGEQKASAPTIAIEAVIARDPDVIIVSSPTEVATRWAQDWQRFPRLRAVQNRHVFVFDDLRLDRMGPESIAAAAHLCEIIAKARTP